MSVPFRAALACALLSCAAQPAAAAFELLGIGTLTGSSAGSNADLSGLTGTLEDGSAKNLLGGLGSGFTWAGGNTYLAVPDRGPNANNYAAAVDNTTSYISRFHTLSLQFSANAPGSPQPFTVIPTLNATTLLYSATALTYGTGIGLASGGGNLPAGNAVNTTAGVYYFSGRSDNFGSGNSGTATNARFDPEAIRVSNDGTKVYISDEYGPYVREFDRATGQLLRTFTMPASFDVANQSPVGATEISGNTVGRTANKGMEALAITPDGKTLVGMLQASTLQDAALGGAAAKVLRIVTIDIASGNVTGQYAYNLTTGSGVSELTALNATEFLVDERDGKGLGDGTGAVAKQVFKISLAGATDVSAMNGTQAAAAAVGKTLFLDLVNLLNGSPNSIAKNQIPAKIEGMTIGQDILVGSVLKHTLIFVNDNDFVSGTAGPNTFYVVGFTDSDLGSSALLQQAIPAPASAALFGIGLLGLAALRRRG